MQCNVEPQCSGNTDFLKFSVLGNLTCAQETRWLRVAWWTRAFYSRSSSWIIPNTAHAQLVDYLKVGRCMYGHAILITRIPWVYVSVHRATRRSVLEVPQHMSDYRSENFPKNFPQKTHRNTCWWGKEIRDSPSLKGFGSFMANRCAVLWCESDLWDETAHSNLLCFAFLWEKHRKNKEQQTV